MLELEIEFDAVRAKRPERLSVVLSVDEGRRVYYAIPEGLDQVMSGLMPGTGKGGWHRQASQEKRPLTGNQ